MTPQGNQGKLPFNVAVLKAISYLSDPATGVKKIKGELIPVEAQYKGSVLVGAVPSQDANGLVFNEIVAALAGVPEESVREKTDAMISAGQLEKGFVPGLRGTMRISEPGFAKRYAAHKEQAKAMKGTSPKLKGDAKKLANLASVVGMLKGKK